MKTIQVDGINYIELVPYGTSEWYFGTGYYNGDLYEAEEAARKGTEIDGDVLCLIHYPDGTVYQPLPKERGKCFGNPVFLDGKIYILRVDFLEKVIQIFEFDCEEKTTDIVTALPLSQVKNCYNLSLQTAPLTLTRECAVDEEFEIVWPEKVRFHTSGRESFFAREGDRLYFDCWDETDEGEPLDDFLVIKNLQGEETGHYTGNSQIMPNGELWLLQ